MFFIAICLLLLRAQCEKLSGPNVCIELENFKIPVTTTYRHTYNEYDVNWCWDSKTKFRCRKTITKFSIKSRVDMVEKKRPVERCCHGYRKEGLECIPICDPPCMQGRCVNFNECDCETGYSGDICSEECPNDFWGPNCLQNCTCPKSTKCNPQTGACEIKNIGHCDLHSHYDILHQKCICDEGWMGFQCDSCIPGRWGTNCDRPCDCYHIIPCDQITGTCHCPPGTIGRNCTRCPRGTFGLHCSELCDCKDGCDPVSGDCECPPGLTGSKCDEPCPDGDTECSRLCLVTFCQNGGVCNPVTGSCVCLDDWTGPNCTDLKRPDEAELTVKEETDNTYVYWGTGLASLIVLTVAGCLCIKMKFQNTSNSPQEETFDLNTLQGQPTCEDSRSEDSAGYLDPCCSSHNQTKPCSHDEEHIYAEIFEKGLVIDQER